MRYVLLTLPLLVACTRVQETRTYSGSQIPITGTCDAASRATLTRRGNAIVLAPANGTLALLGVTAGSSLTARASLTGADKKPYTLAFAGQIQGTAINGTLVTPRCRYALKLSLTSD